MSMESGVALLRPAAARERTVVSFMAMRGNCLVTLQAREIPFDK
jgi:hypothetical protein